MEEETEAEKSSPAKSEEASRRRARRLLRAELRRPEQAVVAGEGPVARGCECSVRDTE